MRGIEALTDSIRTDFLVVGAGVAGLRAAIELAPHGRVLVVAKDSLRESSSEYAQGGVAVALSDEDEVSLHESDTIAAATGYASRQRSGAVEEVGADSGADRVGARVCRDGSKLLFAREGATAAAGASFAWERRAGDFTRSLS